MGNDFDEEKKPIIYPCLQDLPMKVEKLPDTFTQFRYQTKSFMQLFIALFSFKERNLENKLCITHFI